MHVDLSMRSLCASASFPRGMHIDLSMRSLCASASFQFVGNKNSSLQLKCHTSTYISMPYFSLQCSLCACLLRGTGEALVSCLRGPTICRDFGGQVVDLTGATTKAGGCEAPECKHPTRGCSRVYVSDQQQLAVDDAQYFDDVCAPSRAFYLVVRFWCGSISGFS